MGMVVEGFDAAEAATGLLADRLQDHRFQQLGTVDRADRAADAITPVMAAQRALAPPIRRPEQIHYRVEFFERRVVDKTDTIKRHPATLRLAASTGVHS